MTSSKADLIAEVAKSRAAIARDFSAVCNEFDVAQRIRQSVRVRPFAWLGGAAALGYILAGPKRRTRVVTKTVPGSKRGEKPAKSRAPKGALGTAFTLVKILIPLARPALSAYAMRRFGEFAEKLAK